LEPGTLMTCIEYREEVLPGGHIVLPGHEADQVLTISRLNQSEVVRFSCVCDYYYSHIKQI
jgi:hypothetical protein